MTSLPLTLGQQACYDRLKQVGGVLQVSIFDIAGDYNPAAQGRGALLEAFREWDYPIVGDPGRPQSLEIHEWTNGPLRTALLQPPYGLSDSAPEELWGKFRKQFLQLPGPILEVLSWGAHWSPYFEAGLEWWGAYCWTVHHRQQVTVMVASSTD